MFLMDLSKLRHLHPRLVYEGYFFSKNDKDLNLTFKITLEPNIHFKPKLIFKNLPTEILSQIDEDKNLDPQLDRLFFHLGLAEIPSYFKSACPAEILVKHQGQIEEEDLSFWHDLLIKGLGEFYYQNQIDFTKPNFLKINLEKSVTKNSSHEQSSFKVKSGSPLLIPVGGGKDSSTVLAMIEEKRLPYDILLLAPHSPAASKIAKLMQDQGNCQNIIELERNIDPQLLELNQKGYLNGHTPFSAYLAFASVTVAHLFGQEHILLGNEASSEEENLTFLGQKINHQYSKSLEFEKKFSSYVQDNLFKNTKNPKYLSLLRSLSELEITEKLCLYAKKDPRFATVLEIFRSCNVGQKQGAWCHDCPKCAFVFTMFSAFLEEEFVQNKIFSENLFAKDTLSQTFLELAGFGDKKPFECVGTFAEVRQALLLAWKKNDSGTPFLRQLKNKIASRDLLEKLEKSSILILGFGREGESNLRFLRQLFPNKKIAVADKENKVLSDDKNIQSYFGPDYLNHLNEYEIIIKTAGIPIDTPLIQAAIANGSEVLSNTQIFFTLTKTKIIGITGTKGKSTTSQLLYQILKKAHKDTVLLGNIGEAPLNQLNQIKQTTWVVNELSCHQLAELTDSPQIAIVLDIKPEHLDYYSDFASYFRAKSAIAKFQKKNDYLIYNESLDGSREMAKLSQAQKLTHSLSRDKHSLVYEQEGEIFYQDQPIIAIKDIPLIGKHNLYNVMPAILCAKLLGVSNEIIAEEVKNFHNLPHRLELIATVDGVKYIDDSIAVNPHATIMAVQSFAKESIILIAGGYERNQEFSELAQVMVEYKVKHLIALPTTGQRLVGALKNVMPSSLVGNLEEAVQLAQKIAKNGDVVLLSPASASYNSFKNYEERGKAFRQAIKMK